MSDRNETDRDYLPGERVLIEDPTLHLHGESGVFCYGDSNEVTLHFPKPDGSAGPMLSFQRSKTRKADAK